MELLDFRRIFDFIQEEHPATNLNDEELKQVYEQYLKWREKKRKKYC